MVSTSSARVRRTIRPMASLPYLLACAPNSPSTPSVLPPPRAPPKKTSNTGHASSRTWARLPRGDQAILTGRSSAMAPSSLSRRRRRPPRSAVGAYCRRYICRRYITRSPECHSVNALVFEVLAQRQHVRVARPTLEALNQKQSLTAVHNWPLLAWSRLQRLRFPCRIVHQRRDFDHVTVRYLRLMRLPRLAPATIQQGLRSCHAGSIRRMGFIHDGSERLYGLFGVHSCQRRDFERSFSHLTSPRLPATAIGLLDFCPDFIGMEGQRFVDSFSRHCPIGEHFRRTRTLANIVRRCTANEHEHTPLGVFVVRHRVRLGCEPYVTVPGSDAAGTDQVFRCALEGLLLCALLFRGADAAPIGLLAPCRDSDDLDTVRNVV